MAGAKYHHLTLLEDVEDERRGPLQGELLRVLWYPRVVDGRPAGHYCTGCGKDDMPIEVGSRLCPRCLIKMDEKNA